MVEHYPSKLVVAGSIPVTRSNLTCEEVIPNLSYSGIADSQVYKLPYFRHADADTWNDDQHRNMLRLYMCSEVCVW